MESEQGRLSSYTLHCVLFLILQASAAVSQQQWTAALRTAVAAKERSWEALHTGPWRDVAEVWCFHTDSFDCAQMQFTRCKRYFGLQKKLGAFCPHLPFEITLIRA
jgi:hypothetical protein